MTALDLRIGESELGRRRKELCDRLSQDNVEAIVLFGPTAIFYLTGFSFIPTERPLAIIVRSDSTLALVPQLEREHMKATGYVDQVLSYPDYPGLDHPMNVLAEALNDMGLADKVIAADSDGYGSRYGYNGPSLSEVLPCATIVNCRETIEDIRSIKSKAEIRLIQESAKWANLAHRFLQDHVQSEANETQVSVRASLEATNAMIRTLGDEYDPRNSSATFSASASFRSQIGPNSAFPHAITRHLAMHAGDVLVTGAVSLVWGYRSELERTMFVGEPSEEQRKFFHLMVGAQETAFEAMRPGAKCSDVDQAVRDYYESKDINDYWLHHTGHAIGIEEHEAPFLDVGDSHVLQPGMVFTVEPGIFVPGLGGFRHSDTVVVTDDGIDFLTYYPRDLESMVCNT